ncbi:hypothetical protein [Mucilaginibacter flavidus]|uniref:hypothetical protein n=1 Tax=Mucilaginibacter flavidus TaxID=2949309 RepID=UPI0020930239|nr:hypothetical protein [Mucilaginibacter flavidus]MCO5950712.1 hypothetical protein [Mucilaginibacter flavidus]
MATKEHRLVNVLGVEKNDFNRLTVKRHSFNWKKLKDGFVIYKLSLIGDDDILGVIALKYYPPEERTEIKLLAVSAENKGKNKRYERIAGCLIAFAGREAIRIYGRYPCLSLIPKTELKEHYISKYGMIDGGWQLYLEDAPLFRVINEYLP